MPRTLLTLALLLLAVAVIAAPPAAHTQTPPASTS
jgi:hypothetical protein